MRELNVNEMETVSGGNPVVVMLAVKVVQKAAPYIKTAVITAIATVAGAAGVEDGRE